MCSGACHGNDDAERERVARLYAAGYPIGARDVDDFGDVDAFHEAAEDERVAARGTEAGW